MLRGICAENLQLAVLPVRAKTVQPVHLFPASRDFWKRLLFSQRFYPGGGLLQQKVIQIIYGPSVPYGGAAPGDL